jgi:hypothetical protein
MKGVIFLNSQEKIRAYKELIADLEKEKNELDGAIAIIRKRIELIEPGASCLEDFNLPRLSEEGVGPKIGRFAHVNGMEAARIVLREAGGPLHITKIVEVIRNQNGKVKKGSLNTSLSRAKDIINLGSATFDLKERHSKEEERYKKEREEPPYGTNSSL